MSGYECRINPDTGKRQRREIVGTGVNGFSGTDYRTDIKHPGVCYPLSIGKDILNVAMIGQHRDLYAEIIHSESTIFNGVANGERKYQKGRCLTINKGMPKEEDIVQEIIPEGIIDQIFGTKRPQPPKPKAKKDRKSFVLQNQFTDADKDKLTLFWAEMMTLWKACEFEADISNVLKTNVLRGRGKLQQPVTNYGHGGWEYGKKQSQRTLNEINEGLFAEQGLLADSSAPKKNRAEMENYLVMSGFDKHRASRMDYHVLKATYENEWKKDWDDTEDIQKETLEQQEKEPTYVEAVAFLVARKYDEKDLYDDFSYQELIDLYWLEKLDELDPELDSLRDKEDSIFTKDEMRKMIVSDNIMSKEKVMMIEDKDLDEIFAEIYQI